MNSIIILKSGIILALSTEKDKNGELEKKGTYSFVLLVKSFTKLVF